MATVESTISNLGDIAVGQTAVCFAILVTREEKTNKRNEPYFTCHFRAKHVAKVAQVWSNNPCHGLVGQFEAGKAYRIRVVGEQRDKSYGSDLKLLEIDLAGEEDALDGFDMNELLPSSDFPKEKLWDDLRCLVQGHVKDPYLLELLRNLMKENRELFELMPAAKSFHHAYNSGLLEHVWSLSKICCMVADHYIGYYAGLNPPINKDMILVAAIVHDIGKLREFKYDPFDVTYTVPGQLLGHIVLGRDMVRDAAAKIPGFPPETQMLLEHAILSHHGRLDFASPVVPKTIEALIVSFADDLDAKINAAARALLSAKTETLFTEPIKPLEGRALYRGIPLSDGEDD